MTEYHVGRLVDHVHLRVRDLEASKRFYRAALEALALGLTWQGEDAFAADELYVSDDGEPTSRVHIAFQARDRAAVHGFHAAVLAAAAATTARPASGRTIRGTTRRTRSTRRDRALC